MKNKEFETFLHIFLRIIFNIILLICVFLTILVMIVFPWDLWNKVNYSEDYRHFYTPGEEGVYFWDALKVFFLFQLPTLYAFSLRKKNMKRAALALLISVIYWFYRLSISVY